MHIQGEREREKKRGGEREHVDDNQ